jgi:iron-sulfur cluster assembly protein
MAKEIITLTKKAADKIKEIAKEEKKEGQGLRVFIMQGCCGTQYGLDFEKKAEKDDQVIEQHDVKLFVDKQSADFIKGTKIDFIEAKQGFKIDNPNEVKKDCSDEGCSPEGCGC